MGTSVATLPEMVLALRLFQNHPPIPQTPVRVMLLLLIVAPVINPTVSMPQSKTLEMVFPDTVSPVSSKSRTPSSVSLTGAPDHFPSMTLPTIWLPEPERLPINVPVYDPPRVWLTSVLFEITTRCE